VRADHPNAYDLEQHWYASGAYGGVTLAQAVLAASSAQPDLRVVFAGATRRTVLSLGELAERAGRCAAAFRTLGVGPGDAVAVQRLRPLAGPPTRVVTG
jgi:non-ribosomal peptide synthetase component E (peptide arylation enzyme)